MKFLADENIDQQIDDRLRFDGHEVWYVTEMEPGISDDIVLDRANEEKAILQTADKDFGELVYRQKRISTGVILTRLAGLSPARIAEIVSIAVNQAPGFCQFGRSVAALRGGDISLIPRRVGQRPP